MTPPMGGSDSTINLAPCVPSQGGRSTQNVAGRRHQTPTTPDFALTVFPLGHKDIDGLVGMNFLRHFNFEVRPADQQILVELIKR